MNIFSLLIFNELIFYIIITLSQRPGSFYSFRLLSKQYWLELMK